MKRIFWLAGLLALGLTAGCAGSGAGYASISPEDAKARMDRGGAVVLDVREPDEYREGHIPGAHLLPLGSINETTAAAVIPDKGSEVLVYCRSGIRAKKSAEKLAQLGYTDVMDFGGVIQWPYELVKGV